MTIRVRPPAPTPAASRHRLAKRRTALGLLLAGLTAGTALAQTPAESAPAAALRARHASLQATLARNAFQRPLHLSSNQAANSLKGEVHAVVAQPYASVGPALQARENWCDILILHLNVKQCRVSPSGGLSINVGKKFDQPLSDTYRVDFGYRVADRGDDHFQIQLNAAEGPLGTRDYRIMIEATPLDSTHTFIHMTYSYAYGMAARMAMQAYLSTLGSDKVGFSTEGRQSDGRPSLVGGVRGVVERNTMRYYLAIEAYLNARSVPPGQQVNKRLRDWFAATERYARQLHEVDEATYLDMKLKEVRRQQGAS